MNVNNMWGIYKITFPNGKSYIGQSCNLKRRVNEYNNWKKNCTKQTALYGAFEKYGKESAEITYLFKSGGKIDIDKLNELEIKYIKEYDTKAPNGYNIKDGGRVISGYKRKDDDFIINNWRYWDEPIINIKTGKEYINSLEWHYNERKKLDSVYELIEKDSEWIYKNEDKLKYPYGDGTIPKDASIYDVRHGLAQAYVCLPWGALNATKE